MKKFFTCIILSLGLATGLNSCTDFKDLEFEKIESIKLNKVFNEQAEIALTIAIKNPNNFNIKVTKTKIDLFIKDEKIGEADIDETLEIRKNSSSSQTFYISSKLEDIKNILLPSLISIFSKSKTPVKAEGHIKAKAFGLSKKLNVSHTEEVDLSSLLKKQ